MKTPTKRTAHRLAAVLAIITAIATTGAWAEDWTVSENTTLTADTTVDALTVEEGVTLDLNGYKLYCTSLDGSGTIKSTDINLTTPSGTVTSSPDTLYNSTTPQMLFDNDTGNRALLQKVNLPFAVTYDFGVGAEMTINKYKIYGPSSNATRGPKVWTLDGSTDGDVWTSLDTQSGVTWSNGQNKEFPFSNTSVYRYYRITITDSSDTSTKFSGPFLELNEIQFFGPGELHVTVPAGAEATVGSLTISGNMKVVKDGEGSLNGVTGIGSNKFPGVLEVNAGTVYVADDFKLGTTADGTLTINGGTVEVNSDKTTRIGENSGKTGTVNLNGGILKTKRLVSISGTGRVNFDGGTLQRNNSDSLGLFGDKVTVTVNAGGGTIDSGNNAVKVPAAISGTGAMRFKGGNTITLSGAMTYTGGTTVELGTKISTSNETAKNTILANLAIDGRSQLEEADDIEVFQYTTGGLTNSDLANVNKVYCGSDTSVEVSDDGTKILVDFKFLVWELAADTTWSDLVERYGAPAADMVVRIASSGRYTLTIDTDVTVSQIVFSGTNPDVVVNTGATVTTDTINFGGSGSNYLKNDGVIVLNGTATTSLPFHNDSRGAYYINNGGRVNVSGVTTGSTTPGFVPEGANQFVWVGVNGMYDVSGVANNTASVRLAEGATIANGGNTISPNAQQVPQLILDGDAQAKNHHSFGLKLKGSETRLDLGEHTLKIFGGEDTYSFFLYSTTVRGTGKVFVESGKLATYGDTHGDSWSLEIGTSGYFALANTPSGNTLTVGDFVNNGTDDSDSGAGALVVKGTLTPGNAIKKLTLENGATIKATGTEQVISKTFAVSGTGDKTITIDASAIDAETLWAAKETGISVLTVPAVPSGVTWKVTGATVGGTRAKWSGKTLRLYPPTGLMVIFR